MFLSGSGSLGYLNEVFQKVLTALPGTWQVHIGACGLKRVKTFLLKEYRETY